MFESIKRLPSIYRSLPPHAKIELGIYGGGIVIYNLTTMYSDGKRTLKSYQDHQKFMDHPITEEGEWEAIQLGCKYGSPFRLVESLFWPLKMPSYLMSYVVLDDNSSKKTSKPNQ